MKKLEITAFNKGHLTLDWEIICSVEQVIKLGLLGYLAVKSELRLRHYLIIKELKFLGGLTDYELESYWLRYRGQAKEVDLVVSEGIVDLKWCFTRSDIEKLNLRGKNVVDLYGLVQSCKVLKEVLVDVNFSDECVDLRRCFSYTICLERVIFSKAASRAKIRDMFSESGIKELRLRDYVLNVEDNAFYCFYDCKMLESLDCSGVKFNKGLHYTLRGNSKLGVVSFRDCWFGGEVSKMWGRFSHPVTIDLRGARGKGLEKVKSLSLERKSNEVVDEFIAQFELDKVTLILD